MKYAGFWKRVLASLVDSIIFIPVSFLISVTQTFGDAYFQGFFTNLVLGWLYYALCESQSWQATLGKKMVGIKVVDLSGERISFARATGRYFAKFLSWMILGVGYLMAAFTKRKQALHDLVAETLVVQADSYDRFVVGSSLGKSSDTVIVSKSIDANLVGSGGSSKIVMAGFDSSGHVVRLSFDVDSPKLISHGLLIGRDVNKTDLNISDPSISRVHARIYKKNGDLYIEDMKSTNGIVVNGAKVPSGGSAFLSISGTLSVGSVDLTLGRM
jgi:uncharacterized RDD family membrane protein YckC